MIIKTKAHHHLTGHFLVASPLISEKPYKKSVVLIIQHDIHGTIGLILNQKHPKLTFNRLCHEFDIKNPLFNPPPIFLAGDTNTHQAIVLHRPTHKHYQRTARITSDTQATSSKDILIDIMHGTGPEDAMIFSGYLMWDNHALEYEISKNYWLCSPLDPALIFEYRALSPADLWTQSGHLMGIHLLPHLSLHAGQC